MKYSKQNYIKPIIKINKFAKENVVTDSNSHTLKRSGVNLGSVNLFNK